MEMTIDQATYDLIVRFLAEQDWPTVLSLDVYADMGALFISVHYDIPNPSPYLQFGKWRKCADDEAVNEVVFILEALNFKVDTVNHRPHEAQPD